jgi:hypothetical protein
MSDKRFAWIRDKFADLLPEGVSEAVRSDLRASETMLDGAGVQRKDASEEVVAAAEAVPANPAPEEGDVVAQVADKLAADVATAVGGDFSQLTEDKLRAMLAAAMNPEAQVEAEVLPVETAPAESGEQTVEDKSVAALLMTTPPATPQGAAVPHGVDAERVKSLLETLDQQVKDQGQIAQELTAQAQELAALKELAPKIAELIEWKARIEETMAQRPRASEDVSTAIPDGDAAKSLADAINKGLQGPDQTFLGVRVREIPK